ncbi:GNAT family N-acetyltransferase [Polaribacter sp. Hel1_85]|uniref:GNAT family N-acetyltransferase n=1 Tax=Polaribacter sp. Hel1_85 TaxID=1250005 RepID=UPI00052C1542|nr:GNAT family N-acetyltransferase [Polaribacter sp. Hel1_85]KGL62601.1 ribosomal-protein-alanine acetyltransferase [Polaribacter sp. Hel1_85]
MSEISLRIANIDDLQILLAFEQGVVEAEKPLDPFLGKGHLNYYNIPELIAAEHIHFLVAVSKNEVVACGYLRIDNSKIYQKNPQYGYIGFMFVKPSFRGQKISNLILDSLKKWAKEKALKELRLDVYNNNIGAIKVYERFGFAKSLVNMRMDI